MLVAGIIAEYDPFHNGHEYHLNTLRRKTGADHIIVALGGSFLQRGVPAMIDKYARAQMALSCGADLVLEIPALWSCASAEYFAAAGVTLLAKTGVVSALGYGTECSENEQPLLACLARLLLREPDAYRRRLRRLQKEGLSFPAARAAALSALLPELPADTLDTLLSAPNNILAVEYEKALLLRRKTDGFRIASVPIQRIGSGYHDTSSDGPFASASAIRQSLLADAAAADALSGARSDTGSANASSAARSDAGSANASSEMRSDIGSVDASSAARSDIGSVDASSAARSDRCFADTSSAARSDTCSVAASSAARSDTCSVAASSAARSDTCSAASSMPQAAYRILEEYWENCALLDGGSLSPALGYRLWELCGESGSAHDLSRYADCSTELSHRIQNHMEEYRNFSQFCSLLKTRDLTYTRISRTLLHILLHHTKEDYALARKADFVPYLRVLGFRRSSGSLLAAIKKEASVPLITKPADAPLLLSKEAYAVFQKDVEAAELYRRLAASASASKNVPKHECRRELILI